ncbi:phenoloxidase-activating factor 3-like [Coccinella septempunctata]|uniref:phenoloxidase-activating factor 3-like n=1 Tax=Coccinella septempunctata TaxID=41139 RepID=UPI001D072C78|nr:phenoloxidase-activating factor 3-like [Coccinella septempunctata]
MTVTVGLVLFALFSCTSENPTNVCQPNFDCLSTSDCQINFDDYVVYPCNRGKKICCPILENRPLTSKITNEYEFITTTDRFDYSTKGNFGKTNNFQQNLGQNQVQDLNVIKNVDKSTQYEENQEFSRNASLSGSISNRPVFNYYPNDPKTTTRIPISAEPFEHVRFNIPDYNTVDNRTYPGKTENVEQTVEERDNYPVIRRRKPFKENCGLTFADNKVTGGKVAEIGQFPWMALLAFRQAAQPDPQFLCGGSLITTRHVLTAAHCIIENRPLELVFVRLGEYNLSTGRDCVSFGDDRIICADQHVDVPVEQVTVHPEYNRRTLKNDIALIRLRYEVRETDYVRAICLPFDKNWSYSDLTAQNFTVSGWGKTQSGNLFGSDILQFAKVTTWDQHKCNSSIPTQVKPLSDTQICANGQNTEDACKGDSGGPLMNITLDKSLEVRHIQFGIVSFGTATCGDKNLPTIYTRVDKYLKWILDTVT